MDKTFLKRLLTGPLLLSAAAVIALGSAPTPLRAQTADPVPEAAQAEAAEAPMPHRPPPRRLRSRSRPRSSTSSSPASPSTRMSSWR